MGFKGTVSILLHPTSLPGRFGIDDFDYEAFYFVNRKRNLINNQINQISNNNLKV